LATFIVLFREIKVFYHPDLIWSVVCFIISLAGLVVRTLVIGWVPKGTSGRNRKKQMASKLNTKGIYAVVRHPLYLGNFLMWFGLIVYVGNIWFAIVAGLLFWIYYERIMFAEEQFLREKFGQEFEEWANHTPSFFPAVGKWKKPDLTFSVKKVFRREYRGVFAIIISFVYLNLLKNYVATDHFTLSTHWLIMLIAGIVLFTTIRLIKQKSNILKPKSDESRSQTT
jgi:protein-S-isoprenylcysteine O-methyltransferase Ste14